MSAETGNDWCMRVVDRLDRFYSKLFGEFGDDCERNLLREGWQRLATLESIKPMFSTLQWPKDDRTNARAKFIGGLLGHSVAHYETICDPRVWRVCCNALNRLAEIVPLFGSEFEPLSVDENPYVEAEPQFNSAIAGAMRYPAKQSRIEQAIFFEGYTKALRRGSINMNARGVAETTRTSAYQLIAAFGPLLSIHCRTVHDVHRFLEKMMGAQRAGSIKRTEAICKSIDMRLRGAGRPSSIEKPGHQSSQV